MLDAQLCISPISIVCIHHLAATYHTYARVILGYVQTVEQNGHFTFLHIRNYLRRLVVPRESLRIRINGRDLTVNCALVEKRLGGGFFIFSTRFADATVYSITRDLTAFQSNSHFGYYLNVHPQLRRGAFVLNWTFREPIQFYDFVRRPSQEGVSSEAVERFNQIYSLLDTMPLKTEVPLMGPLHNIVRSERTLCLCFYYRAH